MKLEEFNALTLQQKSDIVWEWGYFIANRKDDQINVALFLVNDYLVSLKIDVKANSTSAVDVVQLPELSREFLNAIQYQHPWVKSVLYKGNPNLSHRAA